MKRATLTKLIGACGIVLLVILSFLSYQYEHRETEYTIIQAIIADIDSYREEIESWGYQVSVLSDEGEKLEIESLSYYYLEHISPVLILTDAEGGMYCFYYGFDRFALEKSYPDTVEIFYPEQTTVDALKLVQLRMEKEISGRAPLEENTAEPGSDSYYDVEVTLYIDFVSPESGEELYVSTDGDDHGYFFTTYCSNNFVDHKRFNGIDPESASRYGDRHIKEVYSADELLAYYRQGIELQNRLIELYRKGQEK